jgi:N-acetylneuraminic acid mutarotase
LNDGGRYNPAGNTWTPVSTAGAPAARIWHTAVWTGTEMIVWGGNNVGGILGDGGRYNPAGNSWSPVSTAGAPAPRYQHTAVWTGSEMIVWGGYNGFIYFNDTYSYTPGRVLYLYQRP